MVLGQHPRRDSDRFFATGSHEPLAADSSAQTVRSPAGIAADKSVNRRTRNATAVA